VIPAGTKVTGGRGSFAGDVGSKGEKSSIAKERGHSATVKIKNWYLTPIAVKGNIGSEEENRSAGEWEGAFCLKKGLQHSLLSWKLQGPREKRKEGGSRAWCGRMKGT